MELKSFFVQDNQGNVVPGATAHLYVPGTTTHATGLQTPAGAPLANPFTATALGQLQFAAPDGEYDLRIIGAARDFTMRVRFIDAGDIIAAGQAATIAAGAANAAAAQVITLLDNAATALTAVQAATDAANLAASKVQATEWEAPPATAGQTVFVLPFAPTVKVFMYRNGAKLKSTAFSRSGATVTLATPCQEGDEITALIGEGAMQPSVDMENVPGLTAELLRGLRTFASRAAAVADLAVNVAPVGALIMAGGFFYEKDGTSTAIADMPGWKPHGRPSFAHFGADMTGASDVAPQIVACLNAYRECQIPADNVRHKITTVAATGWIRGTPGKSFLKMIGADVPIKMYGTSGTTNSLNAVVGPGAREITVFSSTADLVPGQWIIIEADRAPIPNMNSSGTAEIVQIETVTGPTIKLHQPLAFNYAGGVTRNIRRINWAKNCGIEGVDIEGRYDVSVTPEIPGLPLVDFRFCEAPIVRMNTLHDHQYAAINFVACHAHKVTGNYVHDLMTADDDVNGGFGYGVQEQAVNLGGVVFGNTFERCRNGYTTAAGHPIYRFGTPMNTLVTGNTMSSMLQSGCSSHEAGYYLSFIGNSINGCRSMGINIRAVGHIVQDNTITNCTGAGIMVVSSPNGDVRDTIVKGNTLIRTNQGAVPQGGGTHANIGAINSNGPDTIITENTIKYCGGQGIRFNYIQRGVVRNNVIVSPCQSPDCTDKWAIGASIAGGAGHYVVVGGNTIISDDGKMTKPVHNPGVFTYHDGGGNVAPGFTVNLGA